MASIAAGGLGLVPFAAGAASLLASNYLCPDMPLGDAPSGGGINGCGQMEPGGYGQLQSSYNGESWTNFSDALFNSGTVTSVSKGDVYQSGGGKWCCTLVVNTTSSEAMNVTDCHASKELAEIAEYGSRRWLALARKKKSQILDLFRQRP